MNRYKVPPCGVWAGCTRTHIERAQRYFKLSSSCIVALVLRYRAAWDNKHVCVCATGHLEHWKLHGFALSSIVDVKFGRRTGGTLHPRAREARRPARAGRGRDQSDGPSGRSGAVRALFHVLTNLLITRSQLSGYTQHTMRVALSSLYLQEGLPLRFIVGPGTSVHGRRPTYMPTYKNKMPLLYVRQKLLSYVIRLKRKTRKATRARARAMAQK